jgi:hypothetical protein
VFRRDGRDWREKRDWQGVGLTVTRVTHLSFLIRLPFVGSLGNMGAV